MKILFLRVKFALFRQFHVESYPRVLIQRSRKIATTTWETDNSLHVDDGAAALLNILSVQSAKMYDLHRI